MKKPPFTVFLIAIFAFICITIMSDQIGNKITLTPKQTDTNTPLAHPININTASPEELMLLPGIGENLANQIVTFRNEYGMFGDVASLSDVPGIGPETLNEISKYITVGE